MFRQRNLVTSMLFMLPLVISNTASQQCGVDTYSIYQMMLKGHTFKTFKARQDSFDCRQACLADVRCQSYNVVMFKDICELNNRTKEARPEDFVKDQDRYYMKRAPNRVPLGSIPALPADSCKEIKASEGGQAVSGNYWLDPTRSGNSILARCDMKTEVANYCAILPCPRNATCTSSHVGYTCVCNSSGWTGNYCEKDVDECSEDLHGCHSNATCINNDGSYNCTCKPGFGGDGKNSCIDLLGWYSYRPGLSCKHIRDFGNPKGDGEYWIDPENNGNPLKVFCDMTTDGGGWLLVCNFDADGVDFSLSVETSYRGIVKYNQGMCLTKTAMTELKTHLPFTQLRFHCKKQQPGRTFHVTTAANSTGKAVVQYFSGQTDVQPDACGSFVKMDDDNSMSAGVCHDWGLENGVYFVGKWGHGQHLDRLYNRVAFVKAQYHWLMTPGSPYVWLCDDFTDPVSSGDFWKVFVR